MAAAASTVASASALHLNGPPEEMAQQRAAHDGGGEGEANSAAAVATADRTGLNALHASLCSAAAIHASACSAAGESEGQAMKALVDAVRRLDPSSPLEEEKADSDVQEAEASSTADAPRPSGPEDPTDTLPTPPDDEDDKMRVYVQSLLERARGKGGTDGRAAENDGEDDEGDQDPVAVALREARRSAEMFRIRSAAPAPPAVQGDKKGPSLDFSRVSPAGGRCGSGELDKRFSTSGAKKDTRKKAGDEDGVELSLAPQGENPARAALSYLSSGHAPAKRPQTALDIAKAHVMKSKAAMASAKKVHRVHTPSTRSQSSYRTGSDASGDDVRKSVSTPQAKTGEKTSATKEGSPQGKTEEKTSEKREGSLQGKTEEKTSAKKEGSPQGKSEEKTSAKKEGSPQGKTEEKTSAKKEGSLQGKSEEKTSAKKDGSLQGNTEEKTSAKEGRSPQGKTEEETSAKEEGSAKAEAGNTPATQSPSSYGTGSNPSCGRGDGGGDGNDGGDSFPKTNDRAPPKIIEGDNFETLEVVRSLSPRTSPKTGHLAELAVQMSGEANKFSRERYSLVEGNVEIASSAPNQPELSALPSPLVNRSPPASPLPLRPRASASPQLLPENDSIPSNEPPPRYHCHEEEELRDGHQPHDQSQEEIVVDTEGIDLDHGITTVVADAQSGFESLTASHNESFSSVSTYDPENDEANINGRGSEDDSAKRMEAFRRDAEEDAAKRRMMAAREVDEKEEVNNKTLGSIGLDLHLDPVEATRREVEVSQPSIEPNTMVSSPVRAEAKARADMARRAMARATKKRRERRRKVDTEMTRGAAINRPPVLVIRLPSPEAAVGTDAAFATFTKEEVGAGANITGLNTDDRDEKIDCGREGAAAAVYGKKQKPSGNVSPRNWDNLDSFLANRDCDDSVSIGDRYAPLGVNSSMEAGGNGDGAVKNVPPAVEVNAQHDKSAEGGGRPKGKVMSPKSGLGHSDRGSAGLAPQRQHIVKKEGSASGSCTRSKKEGQPLPLGTPTAGNVEISASSANTSSDKGYHFLPDALRSWLG